MTVRLKNDIWPFNPKYPNAWRGERSIILQVLDTSVRLMYFPAKRENDWQRMDTATCVNVSPRWAKWFHFCAYHSAFRRHIYHLTVGHVCLSVVPGVSVSW